MQVDPELRRVKEEVEGELLSRPGVTGVDIGYKEVAGRPTDRLAIRVLVEKKRDVPEDEEIPKEIEGHPTDVIERRFELHVARVPVGQIQLQQDVGIYDPLRGGIGIGPCREIGGYVYVGTLGTFVVDRTTGLEQMLSNFHVMAVDEGHAVGDQMCNPARVDGGACPANVVGALRNQSLGGEVDCAVADHTARAWAAEIVDVGAVRGTNQTAIGESVRKRGRTTLLTAGTVDTVDLTTTIDYGNGIGEVMLTRQIGINPDTQRNPKFSDHGDSGAVVVNDANEVVGLNFAGDESGYAIANPISSVLETLGVDMSTAEVTADLPAA